MKKSFRIIVFAMFLTLTMTIFSCGGKNNLFDSVDTENGVFTLTVSDGATREALPHPERRIREEKAVVRSFKGVREALFRHAARCSRSGG